MSLSVMQSFVMPTLSGVCIGLIGVAYRLGQRRGVQPAEILGACCLLGMAVFTTLLVRGGAHLGQMPVDLWVWGITSGLGQYAAVRLFGTALRLGPLAPAWCVISLNFVPTLVYSAVCLHEELFWPQYAAIVAAVLCVIIASMQPKPAREGDAADSTDLASPTSSAGGPSGQAGTFSESSIGDPHGPLAGATVRVPTTWLAIWRRQGVYLAVLAAIFLSGAILTMALRFAGAQRDVVGEPLAAGYGHFLLLQCYVVLMACTVADLYLTGRRVGSVRSLAWLGLLAGCGSVGGLAILTQCSSSGMAFAIAGTSQILFVAALSVAAFGERTSASWYGTIVLGTATVVLSNWREIGAAIGG